MYWTTSLRARDSYNEPKLLRIPKPAGDDPNTCPPNPWASVKPKPSATLARPHTLALAPEPAVCLAEHLEPFTAFPSFSSRAPPAPEYSSVCP